MKSSKSIVESYLKQKDWRVKENSNSPFCYGGLNKYINAEVSKDYWLREVYPEHIAMAHVDGHLHYHDLGGLTLYCCGYSLRDILMKGVCGVPNIPTSAPAKHFDSVLNQITNLTTVFQNEIMGAVAFNGFDTLLAPFIKMDKLSYDEVKQAMQNYVFSINSNSRAGAEPAFSNVTFDLTPPKDLLDDYCIIGGDLVSFTYRSCQQEMDMLNRAFFEIMLNGDANGKLFAYPIPTYNIHERFDWDNPNNKLLWEMAGKYGTPYFANFLNSDLDISDVRSMCPIDGKQKVLTYSDYHHRWYISSVKELYNNLSDKDKVVKVLSNGKVVNCKLNKFNFGAPYKIKLMNNAEIVTTGNHLNKVLSGDYKRTEDLTTEDYLPISLTPYKGEDMLSYDDGRAIGMYIGDGSRRDNTSVVFSLNKKTKQSSIDFIEYYTKHKFGAWCSESDCISEFSGKNSCVNVSVNSSYFKGFVDEFILGDGALNKELNMKVIDCSIDFRQGIIDGLYETDGGNSNRIYTSSEKMKDCLITLFASMGIPTSVNVDEREGRLGANPCYTVRFYDMSNKNKYSGVYIKDDEYAWFKIKEIEKVRTDAQANIQVSFCFEVIDDDEEPVYMLANGVVTHNCRLRLDLSELRKRNGGLFGAGDSTGSIGVVTINLPRLGYEHKGDKDGFYKALDYYLDIAKDSLTIKRKWLQENILDTNAIPAFMEYVGTIKNHFSTIGVVGKNEMCMNFMEKNILNEEAHAFAHDVGEHIQKKLLEYQEETGCLFNYEATPAESTCYRFALKDKEIYPDIYTQGSGKDCYYTNSCHIPVSLITDINSTFKHQEDLQTQFTGGTVIHCYLEGAITGEQAKVIVKEMLSNYKVPYMSLSPISRYCPTHGYVKETVDKCPICKAKLKMYQRITGYLRCVDDFNKGKRAEFFDRKQLPIDFQ